MKRYLRLYAHFLRFSVSKALEFRIDFTFRIVMDILYNVVNIFFFKVLFLHTPLIGGWTDDQMMVFVASFLLVDAINMTVFTSNMWWLPYYINKGDLDYYLIRPVSPLFFLSLRDFAVNSFVNLLIAAGIFIYALMNLQASFSAGELLLYLLLVINGALVYYCIQMLLLLPVFWTHSARGFIDLFYTLGMAMERPDRIFRGWLRILFTCILPFTLIASVPSRVFLERDYGATLWQLMLVTIGLWGVMLLVWRQGLKNYSSASS